ncbi:MAG: acyl-CoA thioesterase [Bacteroidales bacterium]|nr:acyl-CoA thioesterase [Bacteroidales bacterium]
MHSFPIQIRFNDIDILGHVNNVVYGHYFDIARYDFIMQKLGGIVDLRNSRYVFIMVHTEYDFLQPSYMEDRLHVETSLLRIGNKSIHLQQSIVDKKGVVRVTCMSVMSAYDKESGTSFEIGPEWRQVLEK